MMATVEFVSYNGKYPNLCGGVLKVKINGEEVSLQHCLCSGGAVWFDANACDGYGDYVWNTAPWTCDLPDELKPYQKEIEDCVNENIPWGCCGGCS